MIRRSSAPRGGWAVSCMVTLALAGLIGCRAIDEQRVPPYLLGKWRTDAPRYRGASFEITGYSLVFTTVEGTLMSYTIARLEVAVTGESVATILYGRMQPVPIEVFGPDGPTVKFSIFYEPANGGQLRLKNHSDIVWRRAENN